MLGEVHGAMTNVDEGDEHQMERRLYGRRRLEKVHCDAKREHKATLSELAKHWRISRSSWDRSGGSYTGETEVNDFLDVEMSVNTLQFLPETVSVRRGRWWWYMANPNRHMLSLVQSTRGEANLSSRRSSWRQGPEEWGSNEADEGPGATSGLWGATTGP